MSGVLMRGEKRKRKLYEDMDTRGECHGTMEAEMEMLLLQVM